MATQRINTQEKTHLDQGEVEESDIMPAVPAIIIYKLLGFTAAIFILPVLSYFMTVDWVFGGNAGYAGAFAAVVANVVLFAYIVVAFNDDKKERAEAEAEEKKKKTR